MKPRRDRGSDVGEGVGKEHVYCNCNIKKKPRRGLGSEVGEGVGEGNF